MRNADDAWLGGAQGFSVTWTGALLVDHEGTYEFSAGGPTPEGEEPDPSICEHQRWRVMLKRGQRTWILLQHQLARGARRAPSSSVHLLAGVYELTIWFKQHGPAFHATTRRARSAPGSRSSIRGPDTEETADRAAARPAVPRLRRTTRSARASPACRRWRPAFLNEHYTSTLRDIRRTYQRAFKALLFAHRFALSAKRSPERRSELGYMLTQKEKFAGRALLPQRRQPSSCTPRISISTCCRSATTITADARHRTRAFSRRCSGRRRCSTGGSGCSTTRAMRDDVAAPIASATCGCCSTKPNEKQPAHPAYLLRHMGIDARHWQLDVHYFQAQGTPVYALTSDDLEDDRWVVRAWHADEWIRRLLHYFCGKDISEARPDLWASDDPSAVVPGAGPTATRILAATPICSTTCSMAASRAESRAATRM